MRKGMKKKILILFSIVLALSLTACGESKTEVKNVKEHVYRAEELDISGVGDSNSVNRMFLQGDRMHIMCNQWDETGNTLIIENRKIDGTDSHQIKLSMGNNQNIMNLTADDAGNYYSILNEYFEDSSDPDNYIWENNYFLTKMDSQGKEVWRQELKSDKPDVDYFGASWMDILGDGRIGLLDENGISIYDTEGKLIKKSALQSEITPESVFLLEDGSLVIKSYKAESNKYALNKLDVETGQLSEDYTIPGDSGGYSYYPGIGWDMLLMGRSGVFGYNLGDENITELMNIIDSDINSSYIYNIEPINQTEFYGMYSDNLTNETVIAKFIKIDPKDVVDKKVLTLGCYGVDWDIRNNVVKFNKTNAQYRIRIKDYSEFNTENDYEAGMSKLNTDIASGNVPDVLVLQNNMPVESYISKGLFEDLYPYIEKDEELDSSTFFPNVLKAFETNGKLYQLVPNFNILTVAGKSADVGTKEGWTLDELNAVMEKKPKGTVSFADMTRSNMLSLCMQMSGDQYINWETGECKFNSDSFVKLLEFLKQFPDTIDYSDDNSMMRSYESQWRTGDVLLNMLYLSTFTDYNDVKKRVYGDDVTLVGFPSNGGKGAVIMPNMNIVMSAKSSDKDGAWQFMRYFLTDEFQKSIGYGWPLSMKPLDAKAKDAMKNPFYEDEKGNIIEYEPTYNIDGVDVIVTPMTQEDIDKVLNYVKSIDQVFTYNLQLENIISEEAAPYFSGQKNAKEVVDIIQSRAQIYVNENR